MFLCLLAVQPYFKRIQNPVYRRIAWAGWILTALLALLGTLFVYPQLYQSLLGEASQYTADLQRLHITPGLCAVFPRLDDACQSRLLRHRRVSCLSALRRYADAVSRHRPGDVWAGR